MKRRGRILNKFIKRKVVQVIIIKQNGGVQREINPTDSPQLFGRYVDALAKLSLNWQRCLERKRESWLALGNWLAAGPRALRPIGEWLMGDGRAKSYVLVIVLFVFTSLQKKRFLLLVASASFFLLGIFRGPLKFWLGWIFFDSNSFFYWITLWFNSTCWVLA